MTVTSAQMQEIVADLSLRDARMKDIISRLPLCTLGQNKSTDTHFESLVESVISQQLSVKAADTIYGRLVELAGKELTPERVIALPEEEMRNAGISGAKTRTIRGLALAAVSEEIDINNLHEVEDDELVAKQLTQLWGIGSWTVDMFMMHQLGRLDIWPTGDLGVRRGREKIYSLESQIDPKHLELEGEKFSPYRSVVAWYCWRAGDE
jgi:DNA-3-methyladenine glycosylase II